MRIRWICPQGQLEGMSNCLVIYLQMASIRRMEPRKEAAAESFLGRGLECTQLLVLVLANEALNQNTISSFNVDSDNVSSCCKLEESALVLKLLDDCE
jgi:hypothetical protein